MSIINLNKPSEQRLINRWKNIHRQNIKILKCFVCEYENNEDKFEKKIAKDIFHA